MFSWYKILAVVVVFISVFFTTLNPTYLFEPRNVTNYTYEKYETSLFTYEIIAYPAFVNVTSAFEESIIIGIANDPDNMGFGMIPAGSRGKRVIRTDNNDIVKAKVRINKFGNISKLLDIRDTSFILNQNESHSVNVHLKTEGSTPFGVYRGEIDLIIIKPKYKGLEFLLAVI